MEATDPSEHRARSDEAPSTASPLDDPISPCAAVVPAVPTEKCWPAWMVFFTAWLLPATTARRTQQVTLRKAFLVHAIAIIIAVLLCTSFTAIMISLLEHVSLWELYNELLEEITREFRRHAKEMIAVIGLTILGLEAGFFFIAFLLAPWGAVDEKIRSTYANALRQCWLFTAALVPYALMSCLIFFSFILAQKNWYISTETQLGPWPSLFPTRPPPNATTQQKTEYEDALAKWQTHYQEYWQKREKAKPWYLKYDDELAGYAGCVGGAWLLWVLLRMVGARRHVPPLPRPPTCEYCGYNLTGASMEGRCPECGEPVILSLGPEVRPGTPWQHRRGIGFFKAWWRSTSEAILHPRSFGQKIQTISPGTEHRLFFTMYLPFVFIIAVTSVLMLKVVDDLTWKSPINIPSFVVWQVAPSLGYFTAMTVLVIPLLISWLVAIYLYFEEKRNLTGAAMQIACYLGGFLLLWALLAGGITASLPALNKFLRYLLHDSRINRYRDLILFIIWLIPNLGCLGLYLRLVFRGTAAARYANR